MAVKFEIGTYAIDCVSEACGPGGDGQCDGFCDDNDFCDCGCHKGHADADTIAEYEAWHKAMWAPEVIDHHGNTAPSGIYAPNGVTKVVCK